MCTQASARSASADQRSAWANAYGDALGVSRQVADCHELAAARGWDITEHYVDDDISAYSGKPRPDYRRMLADTPAPELTQAVAAAS